jgi:hypothetical protein
LVEIVIILIVGAIVASLIYKNINMLDFDKIQEQNRHKEQNIPLEDEPMALPNSSKFEKYSFFSILIQEYVRKIRSDIENDNESYRLKEESLPKKGEILELLSDALRKLTFFETLLSKNKPIKEIERDMFDILEFLDDILCEHIVDGETLADTMRVDLADKHQQIFS